MPETLTAPPPPTTQDTPPVAPISGDSFADFDKTFPDGLDNPEPAPPSPPPATEVSTDDKQTTTAAEKPTVQKTDKPAEKPSTESANESEDEFTPPQVAKPSELRGWALRMGKKAKEAEREMILARARILELESAPPKQLEDNSAMAQELAAKTKRLEAMEQDLRMTKYERSQEYKDKFEKPYKDAVGRAYREVKELLVSEPNPDDAENPRERAATAADFDEVYALPLGQASRLAKAKFGDAAGIVMQHRQTIRAAAEAGYAAVEEYKAKGSEYEKSQQAQQAQQSMGMMKMFTAASEAYIKKNPEFFQLRDGDPEGNEIFQKSKAFADSVFAGSEGLAPHQVAMRDARAHSWIAAYPRVARDLKKTRGELAEATKTIEALRGSGPGTPKPGLATTDKKVGTWEEGIDALPD